MTDHEQEYEYVSAYAPCPRDRVTITFIVPYGYSAEESREGLMLKGVRGYTTTVERPVPEVVEVIGAIYGHPAYSTERVVCTDPDDAEPWLVSRSAGTSLGLEGFDQWVKLDHVEKLVREHGYVRLDDNDNEGVSAS